MKASSKKITMRLPVEELDLAHAFNHSPVTAPGPSPDAVARQLLHDKRKAASEIQQQPSPWKMRGLACGFAVLSTILSLFACAAIPASYQGGVALVILQIPIAISAFLGGLFPGLVATAIATAGAGHVFPGPAASSAFLNSADYWKWAAILVAGITNSALFELLHRARRNSESREKSLAFTLSSIGDGVITTDMSGRITFMNTAAGTLTGWKTKEALGQPVEDVLQFTDRKTGQSSKELTRSILKHGDDTVLTESATLATKDSRRIVITAQGSPIRKSDGAIDGTTIVFSEDFRHSREAEALRISERLYRVIAHNIPGGAVLVVDHALNCIIAEGRLLGTICCDNARMGPLSGMFAPDACESLTAPIEAAFEGESTECEFQVGDCVVSAEYVPLLDETEKIRAVMILARDITQRKQAEVALSQSEERHRALLETSFDWIWETDADMRFTYTSDKVIDIIGYHPSEMLGRKVAEFMAWDDSDASAEVLSKYTTSQQPFASLEIKCRQRSGKSVAIEMSAMPFFDSEGAFHGYRGCGRDITEREHLESQLRHSQKMEAIGTLAAGIAHDFNNILTVIEGHASLLTSTGLSDDDIRNSATEIVESSERAASLTRQLLIFGRKQIAQPVSLCLNKTVSDLTKMLGRIMGEHISIKPELKPDLPPIHADPGMMEQILVNLAVNARDAMPDGGQLTIATGTGVVSEDEENKHPDAHPGPYVYIAVTDTGCGIAPEHIPHIFEPFFTTKEVGKGSGLGLATIYGIVAQHDGWISITTKKERGTTFRICFPEFKAPPAAGQVADTRHALPRGNETILVAEDDPTVRLVVGGILRRCGYKVIEAVSGVEALDIWKTHRDEVDLLLTDMVMPDGVTGRDLAEKLLAQKAGLKVIYSSGYSPEVAGGELQLKEGVNFLQKPYNPRQLAQIIRQRLDLP